MYTYIYIIKKNTTIGFEEDSIEMISLLAILFFFCSFFLSSPSQRAQQQVRLQLQAGSSLITHPHFLIGFSLNNSSKVVFFVLQQGA